MTSFQNMDLPEELKSALVEMEFFTPTEIQAAVIPVAMGHKDIMACAETGSGKTAAYGIPMVNQILKVPGKTGLILAPTRELAHQISDFMRELTKHCEDLRVSCLVGGSDMKRQLNSLKRRPRIIVATPGRLTDHLKRRSLQLQSCSNIVLDEGDRMLDMGFAPQLDVIIDYLPQKRQTSLFTATLPKKVQDLAEMYLLRPERINAGRVSLPVEKIKQSVVQLGFKEKDDRIVDELNARQGSIIVFARTKHRTNVLYRNLKSYGFEVDMIHGDRSQGQRNKAIADFRKGKTRILCATDIAARGIDVPSVEHVINFDLPRLADDYVHRIGRTARNGASGEAVSFVTPEEHKDWLSLAKKYRIPGVELKGVSGRSSSRSRNEESGRPQKRRGRPVKEEYLEASSFGGGTKRPFGRKKRKLARVAAQSSKNSDFDDNDLGSWNSKPGMPSKKTKKKTGKKSFGKKTGSKKAGKKFAAKKNATEKSGGKSFGKKKVGRGKGAGRGGGTSSTAKSRKKTSSGRSSWR